MIKFPPSIISIFVLANLFSQVFIISNLSAADISNIGKDAPARISQEVSVRKFIGQLNENGISKNRLIIYEGSQKTREDFIVEDLSTSSSRGLNNSTFTGRRDVNYAKTVDVSGFQLEDIRKQSDIGKLLLVDDSTSGILNIREKSLANDRNWPLNKTILSKWKDDKPLTFRNIADLLTRDFGYQANSFGSIPEVYGDQVIIDRDQITKITTVRDIVYVLLRLVNQLKGTDYNYQIVPLTDPDGKTEWVQNVL